uniref:Histone demethylase JARID1 n=1 Tax=Kwoniella dejecticola CBS 10117 TaxID=1296121 RepID=A0A1A6ACY9_9TREE|nr:uncharacterized protein I303_02134 [Kwoniella dejecticola CBS 10117]OBR87919.1 hypothetical protein I303_02134 [Kwoniella dejecticola CBS 10117]
MSQQESNASTSTPGGASQSARSRMGSFGTNAKPKPKTPRGTPAKNDGTSRPSIKPSPSDSSRRKPTFTSSLNYPEVLPAPTYFANEGELQRSQRRSKVEALTKLDRAGTPIQVNNGSSGTSFLPSSAQSSTPQPVAGPSAARNPLHRPVVVSPPFNPLSVRQEAPRHPPPRTSPRLFGIEECPTYYPTAEQFKDCMGYIASIADEAKPYGICKIVPPEGWKMPFTLDSETFRFRTRLQRLNKLEAASRAKINFLDQLSMFHNQSSENEISIPRIEREPLDLWKLRKEVNKSGGYLELDRTKGWPELTERVGHKGSWSGQVRSAYMEIILPFDNYSVRAKSASASPLTPLNNSAINGNGTVKPPAFATDAPPSPSQMKSAGRMGAVKQSPRTRTSSRMSGIGLGASLSELQPLPTPTSALPTVNGLQDAVEIERPSSATPSMTTVKIKVPGFSTASKDGSESELSDADSSSDGSPRGKVSTPEYKKGDICEICRFGHAAEKILLCDGCDRGFHTYCLNPPLASVPTNEEWFCTSCLLSQGDDFGFGEGEDHSVASFQARDASFSWHWWNRHRANLASSSSSSQSPPRSKAQHTDQSSQPANPLTRHFGKVAVTEDDVEREFWRLTESQSDTVEIEYGADVHSTTHGSAGPTMETHPLEPYSADGWNLNNMPILPDSLLRYIRSDISGMTVPWIYLGMMFSTFCWHNEDHYTYSVNYMYWGETKTWYGVPGSDAEKFEEAMKSEAPELFEQQPGLLFQLVTMMNPGRVKEAGVKVVACDQRPNEFVITFPKAYHCGFNHGINMNEAVNFALPDWLPDGLEAVMRYQQHAKPPVFSHDELLITITLYSETIRTALWLRENLAVMVESEGRRRARLRIANPTLNESQTEEDAPEDQYQCAVCKSFCYLAQITCTCTGLVACLDHADQLCACPMTKKTLRKRYSEDQLDEILQIVTLRAAQPDAWRARLYALLEAPRPPLKSMRALVADGEKIAYPMPEVSSLRALVDRANSWVERVSLLVTRKTVGRRRKGKKEEDEDDIEMSIDRSPETLSALLSEAEKLAFDAPEILQLRQSLMNIQGFQSEASLILSTPETDLELEKCKTALILGESLNLDLPEITAIANIVNRLTWFRKVEEEVDDRTLEFGDTVDLLEQAEEYEIPEDHPTISELKKRRQRGADWLSAVDKLLNSPRIQIEEISELIEGKDLIPVSIDKMRQLESIRKTVLNWQASAKNLLSTNGSALAAGRLCKNVASASPPISQVEIPEMAELQAELDHHARWQSQICRILEIPPAKLGNTMNYLKREFESHLNPADDEPNDQFVCFCRGSPGNVMIKCQNCQGDYHPKCIGISPKYFDQPYQCEMCQRLLPGLSPSLNDFGVVVVSPRWNFKITPPEFKVAQEILELALRYSSTVLTIIDPKDTAEPCLDISKIQHSIRKIYNLPLLIDATNVETKEKVVFISWLFRRLQNAIKFHNGLSTTTANGGEKQKSKGTRGRKPKLTIAQSYPKKFRCICQFPDIARINQMPYRTSPVLEEFDAAENNGQGRLTVECSRCSQAYHNDCVKAEVEAEKAKRPFWRCPCCAVKEAKYYMKGVEVRVQMKEQFGTNQYLDYRSTINDYAETPVIVTLQPSTDVIILECTNFVPPILPEDFTREGSAAEEDGQTSRKRRKTRPSEILAPAPGPAPAPYQHPDQHDQNGLGNGAERSSGVAAAPSPAQQHQHRYSPPPHHQYQTNGYTPHNPTHSIPPTISGPAAGSPRTGHFPSTATLSSHAPTAFSNLPSNEYVGPQTAYPSPVTHPVHQPQTARLSDPPLHIHMTNGGGDDHPNDRVPSRSPPHHVVARSPDFGSSVTGHNTDPVEQASRGSPTLQRADSPPRQPPPHTLPSSQQEVRTRHSQSQSHSPNASPHVPPRIESSTSTGQNGSPSQRAGNNAPVIQNFSESTTYPEAERDVSMHSTAPGNANVSTAPDTTMSSTEPNLDIVINTDTDSVVPVSGQKVGQTLATSTSRDVHQPSMSTRVNPTSPSTPSQLRISPNKRKISLPEGVIDISDDANADAAVDAAPGPSVVANGERRRQSTGSTQGSSVDDAIVIDDDD